MGRKTNRTINVAFAGCGSITARYFKILETLQGLNIVGLTDLRRAAAIGRSREFGLPHDIVYDDLDTMLADAQPHVVFDCTIPEAHYEITTKSLRAGCHVLGEKPMSDSMAKARKMVAEARKARRIYTVAQQYRYHPFTRAFAKLIHERQIGRLDMLNADCFGSPVFGGFRERIPNPLLVEMAIHTFDAARMISASDPVSVYCYEHQPKGSWYRGGKAAATAIFEMTGGVVFTYRGHWCAMGCRTSGNSEWRAVGDKGTAIYDGNTPAHAELAGKPGKAGVRGGFKRIETKPIMGRPEGHEALISDFIDCVRTGRKPETNCTDNIKSLAMVFASIKSAKTGRRVKVQW